MRMLSRRRCPHTGIINFFPEKEPYFSIGSVTRIASTSNYQWRSYVDDRPGFGVAPDMATAERFLVSHCRETVGDLARTRGRKTHDKSQSR
jgi:hypothetical protein